MIKNAYLKFFKIKYLSLAALIYIVEFITINVIINKYNIAIKYEIIEKASLNIGYFILTKAKALIYGMKKIKQEAIKKFINK